MALKECQEMVTKTTSDLEEHLEEIDNKLQAISLRGARILGEDTVERVDQARTNVFEDVSAAQDAHQVIAATLGDLISAKRVTAGLGISIQ